MCLLLIFQNRFSLFFLLAKEPAPSKASLKNKKKREAKKAKKLDEVEENVKTPPVVSSVKVNLTGDPEHDKKLRNIKKVRRE